MNSIRSLYLAISREGEKFIGSANEVSKFVHSRANNVRRMAEGGYTNGYLIKQISTIYIVYCIDIDGKHYESIDPKELQGVVWYAPHSIKHYCIHNTKLNDGTQFSYYRKQVDFEMPTERIYYK